MRLLNHENVLSIRKVLLPECEDFKDIYVVTDLMDTDLHEIISDS